MTKPLRRILYARFSPRPNAAECESCEAQLAQLREYAEARGWEIVGEFQDKALSGGDDWSDRPGMCEASGECKRNMIFVVRSFDRLFRDTTKAMIFAAMMEAKGARIHSITEESACDGSPVANMVRTIFLAIAEYQREMGNARTRAAMLRHQAGGRRMSCEPPYGTMRDPRRPTHLITNTEEIATIDTIKQLYKGGMTLRGIARELTKRKVERRGKYHWNHTLVRRVLIREGLA